MQIRGFNKTTLLDYPEHLAATIFLGGCNFRCPFCHNSSLVTNTGFSETISPDEILEYLNKRKNILEGVCITGGEPTLNPKLSDFIKEIKKIGLKVKLDTNGYNPSSLIFLLANNLLDYIAMDIKSSKDTYALLSGIPNIDISLIDSSISIIMNSGIDYEFRTTVVSPLHTKDDFKEIAKWIQNAKAYYLQPFTESEDILCNNNFSQPSKDELLSYINIIKPLISTVKLRGLE